MPYPWLSARSAAFDSSGIRKVFDLAAKMTDPINLSIGQPDFDVPDDDSSRRRSRRFTHGKNGYSPTQGIAAAAREAAGRRSMPSIGHADRKVFITSGTSGGLVLAMLALVNPGDEVIVFDPYFVMYEPLVKLAGGKAVLIDTYPDFRIDLDKVAAAITPRTKVILFNSPANPTGVTATAAEDRGAGRAGGRAQHRADQRRNLSQASATTSRSSRPPSSTTADDRDRRLLQEPTR